MIKTDLDESAVHQDQSNLKNMLVTITKSNLKLKNVERNFSKFVVNNVIKSTNHPSDLNAQENQSTSISKEQNKKQGATDSVLNKKLPNDNSCEKKVVVVVRRNLRKSNTKNNINAAYSQDANLVCKFCKTKFANKTVFRKHVEARQSSNDNDIKLQYKCDKIYDLEETLKTHGQSIHANKSDNLQTVIKLEENENSSNDPLSLEVTNQANESMKQIVDIKTEKNDTPTKLKEIKADQSDSLIESKKLQNNFSNPTAPNDKLSGQGSFKKEFIFVEVSDIKEEVSRLCYVCGKTFSHTSVLNKHIYDVHIFDKNDKKYQRKCPDCEKTFNKYDSLRAHINTIHRKPPYICGDCGKNIATKHRLKNHIKKSHSGLKNYQCSICEKSFYSKYNLTSHIRQHTGEEPFTCEQCPEAFKHRVLLKRHMKYRHGIDLWSTKNDSILDNPTLIDSEALVMDMNSIQLPYVCDICSKSFATNHQLKNHNKLTHSGFKNIPCPFCEKAFLKNSNLKSHIRQHTGEEPFQCERCPKAFKQRVSLKYHMKNTHGIDLWTEQSQSVNLDEHLQTYKNAIQSEPFDCGNCGQDFVTKHQLINHIKLRHLTFTNHPCPFCKQTFSKHYNLKVHIRKHTGEEPFKCEHCPERYKHRISLKRHMKNSHGINLWSRPNESPLVHINIIQLPYICGTCEKKFSTKRRLRNHIKLIHLNDKNYVCPFCEKAFLNNYNLSAHIRQHTGEQPFKCKLCPKRFKHHVSLKHHLKNVHGLDLWTK